MESKAKAAKKQELKPFDGLQKFVILKDSKHLKKGQEIELTYELYLNLYKKKLV